MVYSVETVTEAFGALLLLFFYILFSRFFFHPCLSFVVLRKNCDAYFFLNNLFYFTIIINQCK